MEYGGHALAALTLTLPLDSPFATAFEIEGFELVTKLPQIFWKAVVKSTL